MTALEHFSHQFRSGRFSCLLGPGGCGKSTLEMRGVSRAERYRRANALIASVGLRGFERPILLMDEPFAALDAQTNIVMQEELLKIFDQTPP